MKRFLTHFVESIENAPLTLASLALTFLALIIARLTIEGTLGLYDERSFFFFFFEFSHTFLFFLCSFLFMLPLVSYAGHVDLKKAANVLLFGFLIILTPPIFDTLIFRGELFWSFYEFDGLQGLLWRFFTLFGDTPDIGITYGVRIEVVIVTLSLALYAYLKSQRLRTVFLTGFLSYSILFVLGTFPSWITLLVLAFQKNILAIGSTDVAALFLSPGRVLGRNLTDFRSVLNFKMSLVYGLLSVIQVLLLTRRQYQKTFWALVQNVRVPQLIYHAGLFLLGMLLALHFSGNHFVWGFFPLLGIALLILATWCAWLASVTINDLNDTTIDALTNQKRPLVEKTISPEHYRLYGLLFFFFSLLLSGIVSFSALLLLLAYQAFAWIYSAPPLRLKRYPGIATLCASFASILIMVLGFVSTTETHNIQALPPSFLVYLFLAYFLTLPIKDFKDQAGDRADHIYTIPVLLGETWAKHVIGGLTFLLFTLSPIVLHIRSLLLPSLFFGTLAFFAIQKGTPQESSLFAFRKLPGVILSITTLYGLVIILFLL